MTVNMRQKEQIKIKYLLEDPLRLCTCEEVRHTDEDCASTSFPENT
jgi:hypothetical protein